jgi:hypothetical protein
VGTIDIPVASIGRPYAANVSDNLQWLAVSSKTRGAVWSLSSGERKMHVRGFRDVILANDGGGIADFPKLGPTNHSLVMLRPQSNSAEMLREIPEARARQYGRFLLTRQSLKEPDKKEQEKAGENQDNEDSGSEAPLTRDVRFELSNALENKLVWSREFPKEAPRFFFDGFSGKVILYWKLGSEAAKSRLKEDLALATRAKEMGNKDDDYLLEVVDAFEGKTVGTLLLETGKGSFDIKNGLSQGDWLVLHDSNNRVLVYSIKEGGLRNRFFGTSAAINPAKNQIVVENYPGELTFYDLNTGDSQARLNFGSGAAFVRFSLDGKKLFVLSGEQTAYAFDVDKLIPGLPSTSKNVP